MTSSFGQRFRHEVQEHRPLPILGTVDAYAAMQAIRAGAQAIYLSGAGVANVCYGLPDLGMTTLDNVVEAARRITDAVDTPLLVDIDTGFGHALNIARTIQRLEKAGVAAVHIEDQEAAKRCGHRPGKKIVSREEMGDRIKAAVDARCDSNFVIMARTDSYAQEGLQSAVDRCAYWTELGADMIFPEALATLEEYAAFTKALKVPVLANITEFGKTPIFTQAELKRVGVAIVLYPLSAFRAMAKAAELTYAAILNKGTQASMIPHMQTREALYDVLNYKAYEAKMDD